jgi:hypothetical protein
MAPKAVNARKRFNRNIRFRGHGPLLQKRDPVQPTMAHPRGDIQGAPPLLVHPAAKPPRATGPRGGGCLRGASTGTFAYAGFGCVRSPVGFIFSGRMRPRNARLAA